MPIPWMDNTKANTLTSTDDDQKKKGFDWKGALGSLINIAGPALVGGFSGEGALPGALAGYYMDQTQRNAQKAGQRAEDWKEAEFGQKERQIGGELDLSAAKLGLSRDELNEIKRSNLAKENKPSPLNKTDIDVADRKAYQQIILEKRVMDEALQDPSSQSYKDAKARQAQGLSIYPPGWYSRYKSLRQKFEDIEPTEPVLK